MTDAEIKKALRCCALNKLSNNTCDDCPYGNKVFRCGRYCNSVLSDDALDLINRKDVEIERLKDVILTMEDCLYELDYDETAVYCMQNDPEMTNCIKSYVKAEAVEKFVEILKKHIESLEYKANTPRKTITVQMLYDQINWILKKVIPETIDGALKEMVGDAE